MPGTRKEVRYKCPVEEKINESQVHVTAESKDDSGEKMEKTWWKLGEVVGSKNFRGSDQIPTKSSVLSLSLSLRR